ANSPKKSQCYVRAGPRTASRRVNARFGCEGEDSDQMSWLPEVEEILRRRRTALEMGGSDAVAAKHERGSLTIRERIECLLDENSFREVGPIAGSAEYDE